MSGAIQSLPSKHVNDLMDMKKWLQGDLRGMELALGPLTLRKNTGKEVGVEWDVWDCFLG